ncbi:MAG: zinc ribbon domain-containing protein [Anaerolinea sp.]|nr:zinc ribbon domain-containing protein [Anaerolinea sp.]
MSKNTIEFTRNYADQSTDKGFQFEFYCDRCGNGHRTRFQANALGTVSTLMDTANSVFGGLFGRAADLSERARSAAWERAHDEAFSEAADEIHPLFAQCPNCAAWVCRKSCWNDQRGLCKNCAPDLGVTMSTAQSRKAVDAAWENAAMSDDDKRTVSGGWGETITATCPHCGAPQPGKAKFCAECGGKLQSSAHCIECGSKLAPGAKFCPECGHKAGG